MFTSPNKSLASSLCRPFGYFCRNIGQGRTRFRQFSFLPQFRRGLKFRQARVGLRLFLDFAALFRAHGQLGFNDDVVTKERGAAEDHHCQQ